MNLRSLTDAELASYAETAPQTPELFAELRWRLARTCEGRTSSRGPREAPLPL